MSNDEEKFNLARTAMLGHIQEAFQSANEVGADPLNMGYVMMSAAVGLFKGSNISDEHIREICNQWVAGVLDQTRGTAIR